MYHFKKGVALTMLVGSLLLAGCAASSNAQDQAVVTQPAIPSPEDSGVVVRTVPSTTNRPSDPPPPSDYDQTTNNQLAPEEASLNQLWGAANGDVGVGAASAAISEARGLRDFSAAITTRCSPILSTEYAAELDHLKAGYESATGAGAFSAAQAYFVRATELCM